MNNPVRLTVTTSLLAVSTLSAATHYVSLESTNPTPPYTNWVTAATNIQDAVGASAAGDVVVVTDGMYPGGVGVNKPVALQSVNGPQFTEINGGGTSRCVSLSDGASLSGFTLTNGWDNSGNGGGGVGCASTNAFLTNCLIVGNSASGGGGGVYGGTLYNSTFAYNWVERDGVGGGACECTLYNCTLIGNSANWGGGAWFSTLYNCALTGNSAPTYDTWVPGTGGGAAGSTLYNCTLTGNSADYNGGVDSSTLYNCIVYFNTAASSHGVNCDSSSTLNYCCTTPLPAGGTGNIALDPQLASVSHLSANSPCRGAGSATYTAGTDIDGESWGNPPSIGCDEYHAGAVTGPLTVNMLVSSTNLATSDAAGLTSLIGGRTTMSVWHFGDGEAATNQPCVTHNWWKPGDYLVALWAFNESHPGGVSATLEVHVAGRPMHFVAATSTNPQPPYGWLRAVGDIQTALAEAAAGDGILVANGVYQGGLRVDKPVALQSVNGPQFTEINGGGRCVSLCDGASLSGFTLTRGDVSSVGGLGGGVWCASTNAFLTNCTLIGNSAAGGGGAYRGTLYNCTLANNRVEFGGGGADESTLYNCTLTGNFAFDAGGGAEYCTLYNCTLSGNSCNYYGGGAGGGTLYNCTLSGNSAGWGGGASGGTFYNCTLSGNGACVNSIGWGGVWGGGAYGGTFYNCTLTGNSALEGGGAAESTLYNCIVYFNTATNGANYADSTLNYCCTTPLPTNGIGNIMNAPLFVDYAGGNLRLQSNSPCINAGNNAYVTTATDLDGRPRIVGGKVDIGAYEFQGPFNQWLQQYGLPTNGSADFVDTDGDGMNNWQEWVCGTCPTNSLSVLRLLSATPVGTDVTVTWQSVAGVNYSLKRSANLASPFTFVATNITGQAGTIIFGDTNATGPGPFFYRVGVNSP